MKKILSTVTLILFFTYTVFSQFLEKELPLVDWRICPIFPMGNALLNLKPSVQFAGDYASAKTIVSPEETAVFISNSKDEYGVALFNNGLDIKWKIPVQGMPLALLSLKGKILAITTPTLRYFKGIKNEYYGALIDPVNGRIIKEKMLLTDSKESYIRHDFQIDKKSGLLNVFLLKTASNKNMKLTMRQNEDEKSKIENATLYKFDDSLQNIATFQLPFIEHNSFFFNQFTNGDFVSVFEDKGSLTVNKIDGESYKIKTQQKISLPEVKKNTDIYYKVQTSVSSPDLVYVYAEYKNEKKDNASIISKIDFAQNKTFTTNYTFDEEAFNEVKELNISDNEKTSKPSKQYWNMCFSAMAEYKDMVIILMEEKSVERFGSGYTGAAGSNAYLQDGLILVYNNTLKKIVAKYFFPKTAGVRDIMPYSSIMRIKDNQLQVVTTNYMSRKEKGPLLINIDLIRNKLISKSQISQQTKDDGYFNPQATIFTNNGGIFNYFVPKNGIMQGSQINMWSEKYKL